MVRPSLKHLVRPRRSVNFPQGIINAAITSKNNVMQTCTPWTVVCRSVLMSVIMTFMFEPAKLQMNWAKARGRSIARREGLAVFDLEASDITSKTPLWLPSAPSLGHTLHWRQPRSGCRSGEETFPACREC